MVWYVWKFWVFAWAQPQGDTADGDFVWRPLIWRLHLRHRRTGRLRRLIGSVFQRLAWNLCDPHDAWAVDAENDAAIVHGPYSMAKAWCKERPRGKVLGCQASKVEYEGADDDA